jgi:RNA polymerase sigma-70 factor (ECF subfamily)
MGTPTSDAETLALVARVQAGELGAFNTLVVRHQDAVFSLAYRFMGSRQAAEDATQEAFLRAFRNIRSFKGQRFRSWLLSIVANACRDELRKRRRRPQRSLDVARYDWDRPELDPADEGPTPEDAVLNADLRQALERALLQLPEEWRLVVVLSDVHGLAYDEVAQVAGIPLGTVKSRIARARARLRDILTATGELPPALERRRG